METFPFSNSNCFKSMFEFAIPDERTARNSGGRNYTPTWSPKSLSERPQFTCFGSGLEIALSKSGCFDPHGMSEKWKNKSIGSWSQDLGGCSFVCLPALVSMFLLPFLSDKVLRLVVPSVSWLYSSLEQSRDEKRRTFWIMFSWDEQSDPQFPWGVKLECAAWLGVTVHLCVASVFLKLITSAFLPEYWASFFRASLEPYTSLTRHEWLHSK